MHVLMMGINWFSNFNGFYRCESSFGRVGLFYCSAFCVVVFVMVEHNVEFVFCLMVCVVEVCLRIRPTTPLYRLHCSAYEAVVLRTKVCVFLYFIGVLKLLVIFLWLAKKKMGSGAITVIGRFGSFRVDPCLSVPISYCSYYYTHVLCKLRLQEEYFVEIRNQNK